MAGAGVFTPGSFQHLPMPESLFGHEAFEQKTLRPRSGAAMMAASAPANFDMVMPSSISAAHRRKKGGNAIEEGVHKSLCVFF
jgi:hypothetical protein